MNRRQAVSLIAGATLLPATTAVSHNVPAGDLAAVQAWIDNCLASWAAGDAEQMFATAADDVEWVNIVGVHWRGKREVIAGHAFELSTMFRGVPLTLRSIEGVRAIGSDVVIAVVRWSVGKFTAPDSTVVPAADDRMTLTFRRNDQSLVAVHITNVQINPAAEEFNRSMQPPSP